MAGERINQTAERNIQAFKTAGFQPNEIGWERGSTGFSGNIENRLNSQMGIQSNDPRAVAGREPFRIGRFIVKWLEYPAFFSDKMKKMMQYFLEDCVKEFSGINSNQLSSIDVQDGPVKRQSSYAGVYTESNNGFTLNVPEYRGQPVRKLVDYWMHAISDPVTGACHFYGKNLAPLQVNKGGTLIYILLGPSLRPDDIEFAGIWYYVTPTTEKVDINNSAIGDEGGEVIHNLEFKGIGFDRKSDEVRFLARKIVEGVGLWGQSYLDSYLPEDLYKSVLKADIADIRKNYGMDVATRMSTGYEGAAAADPSLYGGTGKGFKDEVTEGAIADFKTAMENNLNADGAAS